MGVLCRALLQVLHAAHESREQMNRELAQFLAERDALLAQHLEQQAGDFDRIMEDTPLAQVRPAASPSLHTLSDIGPVTREMVADVLYCLLQALLQPVPREGAQELQALLVRLATRIRACQRDVLVKVRRTRRLRPSTLSIGHRPCRSDTRVPGRPL